MPTIALLLNEGRGGEWEFVHPYHPYYGGSNPEFDNDSRRILRLKEGQEAAIAYYAQLLQKLISRRVAVVTIPSSDPMKPINGIRVLAQRLCANAEGSIDATSCLRRSTALAPQAKGGRRGYEEQKKSLVVENKHLFWGRRVYLLDDVVTSGTSFRASKDLLLESGARAVYCIAIAQTE
jgi:predicted amidophosphoribosyltransferase